jgi:NAD(P)-dependent dehydrogenase (short-subunit alcohol dehydrogenase family)
MQDLDGKVAVIIGGGSSMGRGMAVAFAEAGMKVVVADVDAAAAEAVAAEVGGTAFATDVTRLESVRELADRVYGEFGAVHLLCNNAAVTVEGSMDAFGSDEWQRLLAVNLYGVVNALQAFVPRMKAQGGEAHVVNTAATGGHVPVAGLGPYCATQAAVIGISEVLRLEGSEYGLGVSILCLATVPAPLAGDEAIEADADGEDGGEEREPAAPEEMDPEDVGRMVRLAVERNDLYVIPAGDQYRERIEQRMDRILEALQ